MRAGKVFKLEGQRASQLSKVDCKTIGHTKMIKKGLAWRWLRFPPLLRSFFQAPTPELKKYVEIHLKTGAIKKVPSLSFKVTCLQFRKELTQEAGHS